MDFFVHSLVESLYTCHGGLWKPRAELVADQPLALSSNPPRALIASEISKGESVSSLIPRQNSLTTSDIFCNTGESLLELFILQSIIFPSVFLESLGARLHFLHFNHR